MSVYINLHPSDDYSIAVFGTYVDLKQWMHNVTWFTKVPGNNGRQYMIKESEVGNKQRTWVFIQRLLELNAEVIVRNNKDEEWTPAVIEKTLSEDECLNIETQRDEPLIEVIRAERDIEKAKNLLAIKIESKDDSEPDQWLNKWLNESIQKKEKALKEEQVRKNAIIEFWTSKKPST